MFDRLFAILGVCIVMTCSLPRVEGAHTGIQIEDLYRFRRVAEPHIHPKGDSVVYTVTEVDLEGNSSRSHLWIANVAEPHAPRQLTRADKKDSFPRWSPCGRWILFQSNRSGTSQLWVIRVEGGEAAKVTDVATGAATGYWSPDGKRIAFVSAVYPEYSDKPFAESNAANKQRFEEADKNPVKARVHNGLFFRHWDSYVEGRRQHLFVIDFDPETGQAGEPRDVTPGDRDSYPTSMTYSVGEDFCFSPDGSHLIFTAVPAKNEAWNTSHELCRIPLPQGAREWTRLANFPAAEGAPVFSPDGGRFAFRAQSKPGAEADKWDVYVVDCDPSGQWRSKPVCLTGNLDRSADQIHWARDANGEWRVGILCQEAGWVRRYVLPNQPGGVAERKEEVHSIDALSIDRQGDKYVYLGSRLDQPPEVFSHSSGISAANAERVGQIAWGKVDSVTVPGAGNDPMQMWIVYPPGFDPAKKWPLAYLVHGGPQGAWNHAWSNRWNPQVWAAQGYVVALPNPRGSTGFGQKYTDEISGDWGGKCYVDLMAGVAHLETLPYIDRERMAAAGASFGGYMVNWFQGNTRKFKTLISHCGVYNFESMYATTEELWFDEYEHGGPPWGENRHSYEKHSPHRLAARFQTPMLVIHNDFDFRVPVSEGIQLFTTLQRLGIPSRFLQFPDEGHWVSKPANGRFWHEQVFAWLREYCPPGPK